VLDRSPEVGVTFHAKAREQTNGSEWWLAERVRRTTAHRHYFTHRQNPRRLALPFTGMR
jgi:hypothetical protein